MRTLKPISKPAVNCPRTMHGWCSKAGVGLLLVCLTAAGTYVARVANLARQASAPPLGGASAKPPGWNSFKNGQWLADARTVVAAFRYLIDNDGSVYFDRSSEPSGPTISVSEVQGVGEKKLDGLTTGHRPRPEG